jgi:hypothetical protein
MSKYSLIALPVVSGDVRLLGVVTIDEHPGFGGNRSPADRR